jgi:hypothetical protein
MKSGESLCDARSGSKFLIKVKADVAALLNLFSDVRIDVRW